MRGLKVEALILVVSVVMVVVGLLGLTSRNISEKGLLDMGFKVYEGEFKAYYKCGGDDLNG